MYSTLATLNNKKITAMFYVHLFLEAMYRKMKERRKKTISKTCGRRAEAAESDCILLGRAKKKLQ